MSTGEKRVLRVGLCGLGTVGAGVVDVFARNGGLLSARSGCALQLVHVGSRSDKPDVQLGDCRISRDIFEVARDPDVDVLVELIGGTTTANELVTEALKHRKHVVTANKALIAEHGMALFALAESQNVGLRFEAAVAGGIPIIKALREGLAANDVASVAGIINGTGNFILTEMSAKGREFSDVLAEAQALGYAEADPSFDVDGTDAAHKLVILASVAFGVPLAIDAPFMEGVDRVSPADLEYAAELGYRIKHLGIARAQGERLELRVHPTLIPEAEQIASVDGVLNAVRVQGDSVGEILLTGPGAGALPTASAVVADLVDIGRSLSTGCHTLSPGLGIPVDALQARPIVPAAEVVTPWYLRMTATDRPGVMAAIARILGERGISIESLIQKAPHRGEDRVPVIILTSAASQECLYAACDALLELDTIDGAITRLRVEDFQEVAQ
ncbi:MAG: homoserine dehydrogenase [Halieaceae bacterium]|jgi:homoserine dehydrogenase|nr:homoserine dehydrogenase [Halieaceae bacterium]